MAVIPSAEAKHQHQNDNQDQHFRHSFLQTFQSGTVAQMLCLSGCYEEYNAPNERHRARNGRRRKCVFSDVAWIDPMSTIFYFSSTFSIWPTFLWTLPPSFSFWPSVSKLALFVACPAVCLTLPFSS